MVTLPPEYSFYDVVRWCWLRGFSFQDIVRTLQDNGFRNVEKQLNDIRRIIFNLESFFDEESLYDDAS